MEALEVEPSVVYLVAPSDDGGATCGIETAFVELKNTNKEHVAFKVKTTAAQRYCVVPKFGVLRPCSELKVKPAVIYRMEEMGLESDRFLVLSTALPKGVDIAAPDALKKLWESPIDKRLLRRTLFKTVARPKKREDEGRQALTTSQEHGFARSMARRRSSTDVSEDEGFGDADDGLVSTNSDAPEIIPISSSTALSWEVEERPNVGHRDRGVVDGVLEDGEGEAESGEGNVVGIALKSARVDSDGRESVGSGSEYHDVDSSPPLPRALAGGFATSPLPSAQLIQIEELKRQVKQLLADKDDLLTKIAAYKRTVDSLAGANETIRARARKNEKKSQSAQEKLDSIRIRSGPTWSLFVASSVLFMIMGYLIRLFAA